MPCQSNLYSNIVTKIHRMRCREIGTFLHCWQKCKNGAATLEDSLAVPQEVKELPCDPASIFTQVK